MEESRSSERPRLALVLGGGAARALAHIGVVQVLEREGIEIDCVVGSSMGGLIGAFVAAGLGADAMIDLARDFRFPKYFIPGRPLRYEAIFPSVASALPATFEELILPLSVAAIDIEAGRQIVLFRGPLIPALQATCAVPGVLHPVRIDGRWLVDGGIVNVLPVDISWMSGPDIVVAVRIGASRSRPLPRLSPSSPGTLLPWVDRLFDPLGTRRSFEVLVRCAEIILGHQAELATAMTSAEVLIEPDPGDVGLRDFDRLTEAVDAGRRAAESALPRLRETLQRTPRRDGPPTTRPHIDPVCGMVISRERARASAQFNDSIFYFCSANCRDCFERNPLRYLRSPAIEFTRTIRTSGASDDGDDVSKARGHNGQTEH